MAKYTRFFFGWTLTDKLESKKFITLKASSPPPVAAGRMYFNGEYLMVCEDGIKFYIATSS